MVPIRDETTITQLRDRALRRTKFRNVKNPPVQRTEENARRLLDLLKENPNPEPHEAAALLGHIMNDVFDAAEDLGLDPAGCMTLAEATA